LDGCHDVILCGMINNLTKGHTFLSSFTTQKFRTLH